MCVGENKATKNGKEYEEAAVAVLAMGRGGGWVEVTMKRGSVVREKVEESTPIHR